jgi:hypothetical protein
MSAKPPSLEWADIEPAASKMFNVWADGAELAWAQEAWQYLSAAGLTVASTAVEHSTASLRLVALARIYHKFCGLAWDENPDTPIEYLAEDLGIDHVALGAIAAARAPDALTEYLDEPGLLHQALLAATDPLRAEIFQCLSAAYGGAPKLYSRLWHTRRQTDPNTESEEFEVTGPNSYALEYVMNGFQP